MPLGDLQRLLLMTGLQRSQRSTTRYPFSAGSVRAIGEISSFSATVATGACLSFSKVLPNTRMFPPARHSDSTRYSTRWVANLSRRAERKAWLPRCTHLAHYRYQNRDTLLAHYQRVRAVYSVVKSGLHEPRR